MSGGQQAGACCLEHRLSFRSRRTGAASARAIWVASAELGRSSGFPPCRLRPTATAWESRCLPRLNRERRNQAGGWSSVSRSTAPWAHQKTTIDQQEHDWAAWRRRRRPAPAGRQCRQHWSRSHSVAGDDIPSGGRRAYQRTLRTLPGVLHRGVVSPRRCWKMSGWQGRQLGALKQGNARAENFFEREDAGRALDHVAKAVGVSRPTITKALPFHHRDSREP
jgi:hypothetical protein